MTELSDDPGTFEQQARQRILDAVNARQVADFSALSDAERRVPAAFLQSLISGNEKSIGALCCPLRIRGAEIAGRLLPPSVTNELTRPALQFRECTFDAPVDLSGGQFLALRFVDCKMPAFIGASIRVSADLDLSGSQFSGVSDYESELSQVGSSAVYLNNARLGGKLELSSTENSRFSATGTIRLDGARVEGSIRLGGALLDGGVPALSARSVTVGGNIDLSPAGGYRFEANGSVTLVAAQVTGDLNCEGARLSNPTGRALHCEDIKVESVILTADQFSTWPFEVSGRLNFLSAVIDGSFFLTNARLAPGPDYRGLLKKGGPIAINLQQARISNALAVRHVGALGEKPAPLGAALEPVRGWFLLTGTQVTAIVDDIETGWPAVGYLDIEGASYERIRDVGRGEIATKRIAWLRRQFPDGVPGPENFRPQPYEQLSRVLRQEGLNREANAIAVEKIRMRLAARVDKPWSRIFPRLLMLISHYGYSTSRAMLSFFVFVMLGTVMYATALFGFEQPFVPIENPPEPVTYEFAFGLARLDAELGCPGLDVLHYALDSAMPVIDLGQDLRCRFTPDGPAREIWLFLHSAFVVIGAALSAIVVLTLTGVLRED